MFSIFKAVLIKRAGFCFLPHSLEKGVTQNIWLSCHLVMFARNSGSSYVFGISPSFWDPLKNPNIELMHVFIVRVHHL